MRVNVTEDTFRVEQVIRVIQPSILTSGVYTCKVATFTSEQITSHNLLIFGKSYFVFTIEQHTAKSWKRWIATELY